MFQTLKTSPATFKLSHSSKLSIMACLTTLLCSCTSSPAKAELRNYSTTYNNNNTSYNTNINPYSYNGYNSYSRSYSTNKTSDSQMRNLIKDKSKEYENTAKAFYETQATEHNHSLHDGHDHSHDDWSFSNNTSNNDSASYYDWSSKYYNRQRVEQYERYLSMYLGKSNLPPMSQLLLTARSWRKCGASEYDVPPEYLWDNILPTLQLYSVLKSQGVVPSHTVIRSVYRNPSLNRCAGGASGSKHKMNAAMDLWLPEFEYDSWYKQDIQEKLCQFWLYNGERYNMGLGIYSTGAIHIDTQGYRKWGTKYMPRYSSCR